MIYVTCARNSISCVSAVSKCQLSCSFRTLDSVFILSVLLLYYTILLYLLEVFSEILDPICVSFWLAIFVSIFVLRLCFAFCSAFVLQRLQLSFALCFVLVVARWWFALLFRIMNYLFWLAIVNHLCDCDWFVFGHVIVIRPICLALCDFDSPVG